MPGSERETDTNHIVEIHGEVVDGVLVERAVTFEEKIEEIFSDIKINNQQNCTKHSKR